MNEKEITIPEEVLLSKIFFIRGLKVMLDSDLADLYQVETKVLKQAVRRNIDLFPENFMFELKEKEFLQLRSQIVTSRWGGQRYLPFAFTEHGILQLANVLRSKIARQTGIRIIEVFIKMREMISTQAEIFSRLQELERLYGEHDDRILYIFEYLKQFEETKQQQLEQPTHQNSPLLWSVILPPPLVQEYFA